MSKSQTFQEIWEKWKETHNDEYRDMAYQKLRPKIEHDISNIHNIPKSALEAEYAKSIYNAFDTYDPKKGSFKTHLFTNMKIANRFAYKHKYDLYLPEAKASKVNTYNIAYKTLSQKNGHEPSAAQLADYLGWDIKDVEEIGTASNKGTYALEGSAYRPDVDKDMEYIVEMIYYSSNPQEQLILDYIFGMHGKPALETNQQIANKTGMSLSTVKKVRARLFEEIRKALQ